MSEKVCTKCANAAAGPGGVLCEGCKTTIADQLRNFWRRPATPAAETSPVPG